MTTAANVPSAVIVLAAGAGTRMKSATPKVMHPIGGRSMVEHAVAVARELEPKNLAVVVRHQRDKVAEHVSAFDSHESYFVLHVAHICVQML